MTQLMNPFNPMDFDPSQGGGQWPLGKHPVIIESAEVKATNDNNSGMLIFSLKIIDGPNAGHTGPYRLNLYNQSAKAAEIAHRQLSAVCHVTQTYQLGPDGTQLQYLFNKPFVIEVGYQKGEEPGPQNPDAKGYTEIKRVFDMAGNEPGKKGQAQQSAPQGFGNQQQGGGFNGGQAQQQPQQNGPQGGANAWGGQSQPAQQEQPQNAGAGAWGGNQQQGSNPAPASNTGGGGWQQNQGGNGAPQGGPSWGQRN